MYDRCLYFNTNHLSRVVGKIWKEAFDELGLAPSHAYLLRLVLEKPGLLQREIADELHLEKSTITRFVDKMFAEGYLVRKASVSGSKNEQCIFPTAKARKIKGRLNSIGDELYQHMQQTLKKDDLLQLVDSIRITTQKL